MFSMPLSVSYAWNIFFAASDTLICTEVMYFS